MSKKKILFFGIGAQRSGSTTLFSLLAERPDFHRPPGTAKEYHFFDRLFASDFRSPVGHFHHVFIRTLLEWRGKLDEMVGIKSSKRVRIAARQAQLGSDVENYIQHFLGHSGNITGELTPAYSVLSEERFAQIKAWLEPHFSLRVVFVMRDPVERFDSAVRRNVRAGESRFYRGRGRQVEAYFQQGIQNYWLLERSRYDHTLKALEAVFDKEQIWTGFYEELFEQKSIDSLTDFIGLQRFEAEVYRRENASPKSKFGEFNPEQRAWLRKEFDPVYQEAYARWGEERIRAMWPNC